MNNNSRKRSRWGDRPPPQSSRSSGGPSVSDQEALEALVASAQSKQEPPQRNRHVSNNHNNHNNDRRHNDRDKRPRREDKRRDHDTKEGQDNHSYYKNPQHKEEDMAKFEQETNNKDTAEAAAGEKEKPNFALSGALAQEQVGDLKFREPPEARAPNTQWRLYVFKNDQALETLHISRQSAYLLGRNEELVDIPILHPSASGQHAVLQYRAMPTPDNRMRVKPYLMDLESTNGSFVNGVQLDPARYYELKKGDVLKFGASTREYVLLTENTTSIK